jgi:DNA-binding MarR family transcriptional regulator|tara:strand:- start:165 stop:605 length:441 start_codon:yes stop_codon:yes gene_type:complete
MKLQKDTLTRHGIDKTSRRVLETILRCYPDSIEINELSKMIGVHGNTLKSSITRLRKLNIPINVLYINAETRIKASLREPIYWITNAKISADVLLTQINEIELNENKTVNKKKLILQRMYEEYINELNNLFDKWDALRLIDQLDDD